MLLSLNLLSFSLILERKFQMIRNKHVFLYFPINCSNHYKQLQRKVMLWILKWKYLKYPWLQSSIPTVSKRDPPETMKKEQESYKTSPKRLLVRGFQSTSAIGFMLDNYFKQDILRTILKCLRYIITVNSQSTLLQFMSWQMQDFFRISCYWC